MVFTTRSENFVVPRLLDEFEGQVEFKDFPPDGEGKENPPVPQEVTADKGPLHEMSQRPKIQQHHTLTSNEDTMNRGIISTKNGEGKVVNPSLV